MEIEKSCRVIATIDYDPPAWTVTPGIGFREPGFAVTGSHPAGCINRHDAQAYVAWLRRKTGKPYRLPTEAEWEYAARAGSTTRFSFGDDAEQLCVHARFADLGSQYAWRDACRGTMPEFGSLKVGTLKPNPWGLFDMHGNVWEWAADCYTPDTRELAADGSAFQQSANCEVGVIRGGSWLSGSPRLRSAVRIPMSLSSRYQNNGFRVALSLDE